MINFTPFLNDEPMKLTGTFILIFFGITPRPLWAAENFQLPPEVTPAIRAACETDVRRLCVGLNPSVAKVKYCVYQKYDQLGVQCKWSLKAAGRTR